MAQDSDKENSQKRSDGSSLSTPNQVDADELSAETLGDSLLEGEGKNEPAIFSTQSDSFRQKSNPDTPSPRDEIGFEPYVQAVATFLSRSSAPLTMSIEGEWGSGKSSFMKQVRDRLEEQAALEASPKRGPLRRFLQALRKDSGAEEGHVVTAWFNPWRHDQEESLWAAFALHCLRELSMQGSLWERICRRVALLRRRFNWRAAAPDLFLLLVWCLLIGLTYFIAQGTWIDHQAISVLDTQAGTNGSNNSLWGLVPGVGALIATFKIWQQWSPFFRAPLASDLIRHLEAPDYSSRICFIERFHADFAKVLKAYLGDKSRLIVFVDDLDRCEVPKAAELMQAINLMIGEEAPIMFILGMDREKVAAGIAVKHEAVLNHLYGSDSDGRGLEFGYQFIEKFVQVPFLLPTPSVADVRSFLRSLGAESSTSVTEPSGKSLAAQQRLGSKGKRPWWSFGRSQIAPALRAADSSEPSFSSEVWKGLDEESQDSKRVAESAFVEEQSQSAPDQMSEDVYREITRIQEGADSDRILDLVAALAPALGNNPRRIKQFLNLLRLRYYIASRTGLLHEKVGDSPHAPLTIEKLGKFLALTLRHPLIVEELRRDPQLLHALQKRAVETESSPEGDDSYASRPPSRLEFLYQDLDKWLKRVGVRVIMLCGHAETNDEQLRANYDLADLDVERLLSVSAMPPGWKDPDEEPISDSTTMGAKPQQASDKQVTRAAGAANDPAENEDDLVEGDSWTEPVSGLEFMWVPAGEFRMGSVKGENQRDDPNFDPSAFDDELPAHSVTINKGFRIAKHPVTNADFARFVDQGNAPPMDTSWENERFNKPNQPVTGVSWDQAREYCRWLTKAAQLKQGWEFDLPTEAEWERSARSTDSRKYPWGDAPEPSPNLAHFGMTPDTGAPMPIGQRPGGASKAKAQDMAGNVWEWCLDPWRTNYSEDANGATDPGLPCLPGVVSRVVRGGSWFDVPGFLRCALRLRFEPVSRVDYLGFRVVCRRSREHVD